MNDREYSEQVKKESTKRDNGHRCHECRGSDCSWAWEQPRRCAPVSSDLKWLVLAYLMFIAGVGLSLWGATR